MILNRRLCVESLTNHLYVHHTSAACLSAFSPGIVDEFISVGLEYYHFFQTVTLINHFSMPSYPEVKTIQIS